MRRAERDSSDHGAVASGAIAEVAVAEGYRLLFEQTDIMVCTLDLEGRFQSVNRAGERLTGYAADELVGTLAIQLIPQELREDAVRRFRERLEADDDRPPDESMLVARDGRRVPIEVTSTLLSHGGRRIGVLGLIRDLTSQKSAENALQHSEERFRSAFESAAIGMALVSPDGRWLQVNDAICAIVGYSPAELAEKTFQDLTHPEDLEADLELVRQMLAGEIRTYQMEKRYLHKHGHVVWVQLSVSLVRGGDGSPLHFISQIQDITAQKSDQESLRRSEARLAEAQQIARLGSWQRNLETDEVAWSDEHYRIFGVDRAGDPPTFQEFLAIVHPDDRGSVQQARTRAQETGEPFSNEYRIVPRDGLMRWIHSHGEVVSERDGTSTMLGTVQDITERKHVEERLADAERRYRTLIEQLPLATYIRPLRMDGSNVFVSPQVEGLLGYPADEWLTDPSLLSRIIHPDDWERVRVAGEQVRRTGQPSRIEYRYITPDGRIVWVQDETYVVLDERGDPQSVQGYVLDITERKQAEDERDRLLHELHHSQKLEALGRLAGGVAHDFNNVLTAIKGYSELLLDALEPGSTARREASQIRRAAEQAASLPRQLLAFSRKQVLQPVILDLDEVVLAASDLLARLVGETIELVVTTEARQARIHADPGQVEQALVNLVANARDAVADGGTIAIATSTVDVSEEVASEHEADAGPYAVISVSDDGHGMDVLTKERAFEPFFTTKAVGEGSGLGLATVYGIVRQSGGFVEVESEPGGGSVFRMYVPRASAAAEPNGKPTGDTGSRGAAEAATILLVEDDEFVRDAAGTALERAGYVVLSASGGPEGVELIDRQAGSIDVLVTDMVMRGVGGRELAERMLARSPGTPVILMSGYTDEPPVIHRDDGLAPAFLQKPFSPRELVDAVRGALEHMVANGNGHATLAPETTTCVIADDHPAVLDSISRFVAGCGIDVVARVSRGDEALAEIESLRPTLALLDVGMEPLSGIEVARQAAQSSPESRIVLYTGRSETALLAQALDAGAHGFVLKETPLAELAHALTVVANGGTYVDQELSAALASAGAGNGFSRLTPREREILGLLAEGLTNERVAAELQISPETVQSHVGNAMGKLEADTRTQAVATAIRQSLLD